jgi:hypothetical protein
MANNIFSNQIQNRNFLSPVGFKFTLQKYPKVSFFSNGCRIPDITLNTAVQSNYFKAIDIPGDQVVYGDFYLRFLVDEDMSNYMAIHNWITALGFPESHEQFKKLITDENGTEDPKLQFSNGTLQILNSNYRTTANVVFRGLYPVSLTSLEFEATDTDINYFTAEATFKYTMYNIFDKNNKLL